MPSVVDKELLGKPKEKYWITYTKQRIKKNKNFLGFISGQTGSGKSYSSLRIMEELDPNANINNCVFGGLELMNLINSGDLKKGSVIVMEEVGVEMSNKNWASVTNKMLNYLLQTFRHRNFILIMNSPFMDFVDSSTRKLFHAEFKTIGIDFKAKQVKLKPVFLQYNSRMKKFYYHRLKVIKAEGKIPIDVWRVDLPSKSLREQYEEKKRAYTDRLNKRIIKELNIVQNGKIKKKELTDYQKEVLELIKEGKNPKDIAMIQERNLRGIHRTIEAVKKKGYNFTPVYDPILTRRLLKYDISLPI